VRIRCWGKSLGKRAFDFIISAFILSAIFVVGIVAWIAVKLTSKGPAIFCQKRVGLNGKLFTVYKFRTMAVESCGRGPGLTQDGDLRLTPLGKVLRKLKFDEIPQFYNVLRGDMSIVGPRPKLPRYSVPSDWHYRPGITGLATLAFRREEEILRGIAPEDLDAYYDEKIRPVKARLDRWYMRKASFSSDLVIIYLTATACLESPQRALGKSLRRRSVRFPAWAKESGNMGMSLETESLE
jgi:lipopolysaccharide/colanic/teichoic acid biosynthesis glycosyltransferase